MTTGNKKFIILNSGDFTAVQSGGNAQSFRNVLSVPLVLDKDKQYEVCVYSVFFPVSQFTNSVYVNLLNLCNSNITGSQQTSACCFIPYTMLSDTVPQLYYTTENCRVWYPIQPRVIPYIDVSITMSTGQPIPVDGHFFSTVIIAIREIVY